MNRSSQPVVADIELWLCELAPAELAESWDNVGLLVGDPNSRVERVMTCLSLSPETLSEAIERQAEVVVAHHPLPFRPINRLTTDSYAGRLLWGLASHGISLVSPHTAWDGASQGINQQAAQRLGLLDIQPLQSIAIDRRLTADRTLDAVGVGRQGRLPKPSSLRHLASHVASLFPDCRLRLVGADDRPVQTLGLACGSGGSLMGLAHRRGCDCLITGEVTYHQALEARGLDLALILTGHLASERYAMQRLVELIEHRFPSLEVWLSERETDPVRAIQ